MQMVHRLTFSFGGRQEDEGIWIHLSRTRANPTPEKQFTYGRSFPVLTDCLGFPVTVLASVLVIQRFIGFLAASERASSSRNSIC